MEIKVHNPMNLPCVDYKELEDFQGDFKELPEENLVKLKRSIIENGIFVPKFVWVDNDTKHCIDGNQTRKALESLTKDGYEIPPIPFVIIHATDRGDALRKLLLINSRYGQINRSAKILDELDMGQLFLELEIPEFEILKLEKFKKPIFEELIENYDQGKKISTKDRNWFYVEYYGKPLQFNEMSEKIKSHLKGDHEIDSEWFYDVMKGL